MRIYCRKCGESVDTLAKRRHRCKKNPPSRETADSTVQLVWWSYLAQSRFDHVGEGNPD